MASIIAAAEAEIAKHAAELEAFREYRTDLKARYDVGNKVYNRKSQELKKYDSTTHCSLPIDKEAEAAVKEEFEYLWPLYREFSQSKEKEQQLQAKLEYCQGNLPSLQRLAATISNAEANLSPAEAQIAIAEAKIGQLGGEIALLHMKIEKLEKACKSKSEELDARMDGPCGWQSTSDHLHKIKFELEFAKEKLNELQPKFIFLQVDLITKRVECEL
jgi:chromosome segregation ATPase